MKKIKKPILCGNWQQNENSIVFSSILESITLNDMSVNAATLIESLCNGENSVTAIISKLSKFWDINDVKSLLRLLYRKSIIVDIDKINSINEADQSFRIESFLSERARISNLPYQIVHGRIGTDIWSTGRHRSIKIAIKKLISEISEWNA